MLLTLTTTHEPATDLGYLLGKNPARCQSFPLSFGQVHVFYPEVSPQRCTAALLLDVDPVGLVRNRRGPAGEGQLLEQYVNDRPYVASSFLSVAIAQVYGSALAGRSRERQELADTPIPLEARLAVLPCRGGEDFLRSLFEPLGYAITARRHPLDEQFPEWGEGPYHTVTLTGHCRLRDLLSHLYVLVPVLDNDKHYWVSDDEVDKLLHHGEGWLGTHPERENITRRYLKHQGKLARSALAQLLDEDAGNADEESVRVENVSEERVRLNDQRLAAVRAALKTSGARRVLDLGCGEGKLLRLLLQDADFTEIAGVDVSPRVLEIARTRLDRLPSEVQGRCRLLHGSLMYRDARLSGYDAAAVVEVIEHLDPPRLAAFERVLFEFARPRTIVLTTPNAEYNVKFEGLAAGAFRHKDHRFEWMRTQFQEWANGVAQRFGYAVQFVAVGPEDEIVGSPTQMAVFIR
ncbi:MAG TPA: 3' terminal RNA ribose 2'-O-methyltransferase Hen1 [Gemmataceae bacterium]|nr:3' terminal RNA ribose 2'-O-methyltransferase Hen1 [Gemmataceae bacterium]